MGATEIKPIRHTFRACCASAASGAARRQRVIVETNVRRFIRSPDPPAAAVIARLSGFSRGLGDERAQQWSKGFAAALRALHLALLVLPDRQGECHLTLALVAVEFVHGHGCSSD